MPTTPPVEIIACRSQKEWARWLAAHHDKSNGVWLRLFKKGSKVPSVSYDEALDEALCHGWIDEQLKKHGSWELTVFDAERVDRS